MALEIVTQVADVPQPIAVLLEVLLEKDPVRRFQTPAELLKVLAIVSDVVDARHTLERQSLQQVPQDGN